MTEQIFAWNGMGQYFIETISRNDMHGTTAVAAFGAVMVAISAVLADIVVVAGLCQFLLTGKLFGLLVRPLARR